MTVGRNIRRTRRWWHRRRSFSSIRRSGRRIPSFGWLGMRSSILPRWRRRPRIRSTTTPRFLRRQASRFLRIKRVAFHNMRIRIRTAIVSRRRRTSLVTRRRRTIGRPLRRRSAVRTWSIVIRCMRWRWRSTIGSVMRWRRTTIIIRSHVMRRHGSNRLGARSTRSAATCSTVIIGSPRTFPRNLRYRGVWSNNGTTTVCGFFGSRSSSTARQWWVGGAMEAGVVLGVAGLAGASSFFLGFLPPGFVSISELTLARSAKGSPSFFCSSAPAASALVASCCSWGV